MLKRSPLAEAVDPKSFFMMLNSNFAVLSREDGVDLGPVFEALKPNAPEEQLAALFLQFERKGRELGIEMILPAPVAALEPDRRTSLLEAADRDAAEPGKGSTPTGTVDAPAASAEDADGLSEEQRRVVAALVRAFREAPGSARIPSGQLNYFIGARLADIAGPDEGSLRLDGLIDGLRQAEISDADLYVGYVFARERLQVLGVEVLEPQLDVDEDAKESLVASAKEALRAQPRTQSVAARGGSKLREASVAKPPGPAEEDRKSLEQLGLGRAEGNPARRRTLRIGVMLGVAALSGGLGFVFRPTRPLSASSYEDTVPLREAGLVDGVFQGVIDDAAWAGFEEEEKRARFEAFAEVLRSERRVAGAQVRDGSGRLLIAASGAKLRASPQLFKD